MDNIFGVYKPKGITSNDAVQKVKRLVGVKGVRVGHAGTLDPLAQGVLVIAVGREATKKISEVVKKEKEYIAEITFGFESTTDDAEGEKTRTCLEPAEGINDDAEGEKTRTCPEPAEGIKTRTCPEPAEGIKFSQKPEIGDIEKNIKDFIGKIKQIPPIYSAVKVEGKEAYKYARKGQVLEMKPREVEIKNIEILEYFWPILKIKILTGPGTYIRSLARDIGRKLGVGGYLSFLERTRVGDFRKEDSVLMENLPEFLVKIKH